MKYLVVLLLCCIGAFASTAAERELQLQTIYSQHAATSAALGKPFTAVAQSSCADIHATAAERILPNPTDAKVTAKWAIAACDKLMRMAAEKEADTKKEMAESSLRESCMKFKPMEGTETLHFLATVVHPELRKTCASVGVIIDLKELTNEQVASLTAQCKPFVGKPFRDWPVTCAPISAGLREFLASDAKK